MPSTEHARHVANHGAIALFKNAFKHTVNQKDRSVHQSLKRPSETMITTQSCDELLFCLHVNKNKGGQMYILGALATKTSI